LPRHRRHQETSFCYHSFMIHRETRLKISAAAVLAIAILLSWSACFGAGGSVAHGRAVAAARGKVVLVIIDRIGIDDLTNTTAPNLMKLIERGGVGLMNARAKYDLYGLGSYLVIGAGGRALGGANAGLSFNSSERLLEHDGNVIKSSDIFRWRTGKRAPAGGVVNLYIEEMKKKSDTPQATSTPGLLGQILKVGGKRIAVLGNADSLTPASSIDISPIDEARQARGEEFTFTDSETDGEPGAPDSKGSSSYPLMSSIHREVASIAMDECGAVPAGDVSRALTGNFSHRGVTTNFARLERRVAALLPSSDVIVVDAGQTSRVDEQANFFSAPELDRARGEALRECDRALGRISGMLDAKKDLIIVCSPTPTRKMIEDGELLTPLVVAGPGFSPGNYLRSGTTRRTGLVSNYDIAPAIIKYLGLEPPAVMDGTPLSTGDPAPGLAELRAFRDRAVGAFNTRRAMVRVYVIAAMCVIALLFLVMLAREDLACRHPFFMSAALLAVLVGPLIWLAAGALSRFSLATVIAISVAASALLGLASLMLRARDTKPHVDIQLNGNLADSILAVSGVTLLLILIDTLMGSPLMTFSAFGASAIMGDRYYGVGNLYMGFAVASAILFTCLAIQFHASSLDKPWKRRLLAGVVLGVTIFVIGFPRLGANVGGLIAAAAASLVIFMKLERKPMTLKRAATVSLALMLCVGGLLLIDSVMPGSASHAGRAAGKIQSGGLSALISQVGRKLSANWALTWMSIWRLLLLLGAVAWLVFNWKFGILKRARDEYPYLNAGLIGMTVGVVVAWISNDSGIEAAAAMSVFLFVPCFLMLIPWSKKQPRSPKLNG